MACLYQATLIHCSCKTGKEKDALSTDNFDELTAVSSLIGGRFCSRIFVTNNTFSDPERQQKFLEQARQREIVVVTGEALKNIGNLLKKQATNPDFARV